MKLPIFLLVTLPFLIVLFLQNIVSPVELKSISKSSFQCVFIATYTMSELPSFSPPLRRQCGTPTPCSWAAVLLPHCAVATLWGCPLERAVGWNHSQKLPRFLLFPSTSSFHQPPVQECICCHPSVAFWDTPLQHPSLPFSGSPLFTAPRSILRNPSKMPVSPSNLYENVYYHPKPTQSLPSSSPSYFSLLLTSEHSFLYVSLCSSSALDNLLRAGALAMFIFVSSVSP